MTREIYLIIKPKIRQNGDILNFVYWPRYYELNNCGIVAFPKIVPYDLIDYEQDTV